MIRNCSIWFLGLFVCSLLLLAAKAQQVVATSETYLPIHPNPLKEFWRWNRIELEGNWEIYCGCELDDTSICFATRDGLLFYDGYRVKLESFPVDETNHRTREPYGIWCSKDGLIYIHTSEGLLVYQKGEWSNLLEYKVMRLNSRELFFEDHAGSLFFGSPIGIFSLNGRSTPTQIINFGNVISSIVLSDKNELFVSFANEPKVAHFPFLKQCIEDRSKWEIDEYPINAVGDFCLALMGDEGDVISVSYDQNTPVRYYRADCDTWAPMDLGNVHMANSHVSARRLGGNTNLVFSKTGIQVFYNGGWEDISVKDWDIPINEAFVITRKNGNIILGGRNDKLWEIELGSDRWESYLDLSFQCSDPSGNAWFLTRDGSVVSCDINANKWVRHKGDIPSIPKSIISSDDGVVWVSGSNEGIAAVSYFEDGRWNMNFHPELISMVGHHSSAILSDGRVLFGSGHEQRVSGGGVIVYEKENGHYRFSFEGYPKVPRRVVGIAETEGGSLYVGGFFLSKVDSEFRNHYETVKIGNYNWVDKVTSDGVGGVCIAIWEQGLFTNQHTSSGGFQMVQELSGMKVNDVIYDLVRKNNVWVSTSQGICRFNGEYWLKNAIRPEIRVFREGGCLKESSDGRIWVNLASREWYFYTDKKVNNSNVSNIFQTIGYQPDMSPPIVEIEYFDSNLTAPANALVRWSGIDRWSRTPISDLLYSVRMDGGAWSPFEPQREKIFIGLSAGEHTIEVCVIDRDGNKAYTKIPAEIIVHPVLWKQTWFILASIGIVAAFIILISLLVWQRIHHILKLEEFKLQFFTNLSHEIRTPLTVILWPLKSALETLPDFVDKTNLKTAYRNTQKLAHLIDQILEFRKMETSVPENRLIHGDIISDIRESVSLMKPLWEEKKIVFSSAFSDESFFAWYDVDKVERVVSNLLGNAIKYSNLGGSISVKANIRWGIKQDQDASLLEFIVEDNGLGIPKEKIRHIFEPFYRVEETSIKVRGVGLGLPLVKRILDSLKGTIEVESPCVIEEGVPCGTRFKARIPVKHDKYAIDAHADEFPSVVFEEELDLPNQADRDVLLIVEDDTEILQFLTKEFSSEFQVIACSNGKEAYERAKMTIPDLILTDIMMPVMDGNELIRLIKSDTATRHIPIIALTALKSEEHELKALMRGADSFFSKPASLPLLRQTVKNTIEMRKAVLENYRKNEHSSETAIMTKGSADDEFLRLVKSFVEEKMADPLFDIESMAENLGLSRMSLYRKFRAVTGGTPGDFARELKMQKALELLKEGRLTVSEISDSVGFQEVANFSKAFKKRFGISPSKYVTT